MEDGEKSGASANAAKSLFRMDGSGYLSSGRISWDDTGSLYIDKNVVVGDNNETLNNLVQMLSDFYSWFEEVPIVIDGVNRKALHLKTGTDVGLAGLYADGFISAGGLSSGGGTAGADLPAVWTSLRNVTTTASEINSTIKIAAAHIPDMASTYGYLKSTDAVANVDLNGDYLRVTKNGANTDLIIPYATTARYVVGDDNAAYPQYALLQSGPGRQDASPSGDTWLFFDNLGGPYSPWGIRHNQGNNTIGFIGAGTERILLDMETGAITGASFVKSGGSASQFLKADGSVDSSAYITGITSTMVTTALGYTPANSTSLANYVTLGTEQTITGRKIFTSPSSIVIQLPNNESNNFTEGIRFNLGGGNAWAGFTIGGTQVTGTGLGIWAFLVNSGDFYIGHNGSSNATYGLSWTASGALNLKTSSLTNNDYALLHAENYSYYALPLTGGTLHNSSRNFLYISSSDTDGPYITFNAGDNTVGYIGSRASFTWLGCSANRLFLDSTNASLRVGTDSTNYTIWHSGNDGSGSGLDADLLDGYHSSHYYLSHIHVISSTEDGFINAPLGIHQLQGSIAATNPSPIDYGTLITFGNYNEYFNLQLTASYDASRALIRGINNYSSAGNWHELAFLDSNVASATKLQTARTIWGQSFDGTGNVSGTLFGVSAIEFESGPAGTGGSIDFHYNNSTSDYTSRIMEDASGRLSLNHSLYVNGLYGAVGIGTPSPGYKLHVVGNIFSTGEVISNSVHSFRIIYGNYGSF